MSKILWTIFCFFCMNVTLIFYVWTATYILQISSGTVPLNFVWLSHNALSLTANLLVSFYFIRYPYFLIAVTPFCLFFRVEPSHSSLCQCHTNIMRVFIVFVWTSCASPYSICECHTHTNIFELLLFLSGHSTLFPFMSWLTHSHSYLVWPPRPPCFFNQNSTCSSSFFSFVNSKNIFITTFHISNVMMDLKLLHSFLSVSGIHL